MREGRDPVIKLDLSLSDGGRLVCLVKLCTQEKQWKQLSTSTSVAEDFNSFSKLFMNLLLTYTA